MIDGRERPAFLNTLRGMAFNCHPLFYSIGIKGAWMGERPAELIFDRSKWKRLIYSIATIWHIPTGLRRTNADKRKAVKTLLKDEEWSQWSDREIARQCAVSNDMVSRYRRSLSENDSQPTKRKGADGRTIDTSNIGSTSNNSNNS